MSVSSRIESSPRKSFIGLDGAKTKPWYCDIRSFNQKEGPLV